MTLPLSGVLTLGDINEELGRSRTAAIQLDKAENGDYGTINTCSPFYPVAGNPAKISEWYGYNHNAVCSYSTKSCLFVQTSSGSSGSSLLYGDNWNNVSSENPYFDQDGAGFSFCTWLQVRTENQLIYYLSGFGQLNLSNGQQGWRLNISNITSGTNAGKCILYFDVFDGTEQSNFECQLNSSANTSNTGISTSKGWGRGTATASGGSLSLEDGSVNANNFSHLSITYDAGTTGASRLKVYWNGNSLTVTQPSGVNSLSNFDWDDEVLYVGGSYPSELSSGCIFDETAFFYENKLSSSEVGEIYNSGAPQAESNYGFSYNNGLYRYEQSGNLGSDTNGGYDLNNSLGSPASSTEHA